jgi:hypothetical protein
MEKKIMKPAEICITLLLPTLVDPRRPTFSLCFRQRFSMPLDSISMKIYVSAIQHEDALTQKQ